MDLGSSASSTRALSLLVKLVSATLVVVILSQARAVLVPIAFAVVLAFILTPPTKWLQHRVNRLPALVVVMLTAVATLGSVGYVLVTQLSDLTTQLGTYTESMRRKVAALQDGGSGPFGRVEVMIARIAEGLEAKVDTGNASVHVIPIE
ncbi:MAG TPA: AI-2E family transporter, partial [Myxococcota bacterium]|nr:AI-2E family transporter [Myxococcota bacterium]